MDKGISTLEAHATAGSEVSAGGLISERSSCWHTGMSPA